MDMKLEVLFIPISDVDRAKHFYEKLGFRLDIDFANEDFRVIQFTPPGSKASIIFGKGITSAQLPLQQHCGEPTRQGARPTRSFLLLICLIRGS